MGAGAGSRFIKETAQYSDFFFARLIIDIRAIISMCLSIAKIPRDCPNFTIRANISKKLSKDPVIGQIFNIRAISMNLDKD